MFFPTFSLLLQDNFQMEKHSWKPKAPVPLETTYPLTLENNIEVLEQLNPHDLIAMESSEFRNKNKLVQSSTDSRNKVDEQSQNNIIKEYYKNIKEMKNMRNHKFNNEVQRLVTSHPLFKNHKLTPQPTDNHRLPTQNQAHELLVPVQNPELPAQKLWSPEKVLPETAHKQPNNTEESAHQFEDEKAKNNSNNPDSIKVAFKASGANESDLNEELKVSENSRFKDEDAAQSKGRLLNFQHHAILFIKYN